MKGLINSNVKKSSNKNENEDSETSTSTSSATDLKNTKNGNVQQFSVLRSDGAGLRMKISAIPNKVGKDESSVDTINISNNRKLLSHLIVNPNKKRKMSTDSSSSCCSICSVNECGNISNNKTIKKSKKVKINRIQDQRDNINVDKSLDNEKLKVKKIEQKTITHLQRSASLQSSGLSSSDTELPALVNEAIRRVNESESENESVPKIQYTSKLLQDFMAKTSQMGSMFSDATNSNEQGHSYSKNSLKKETDENINNNFEFKKRRGRPKKSNIEIIPSDIQKTSFPNVSRVKETNEVSSSFKAYKDKIDISTLDKHMYATERTLYPPKPKKNNDGKSSHSKVENKSDDLDPLWEKIDIHTKFRRPSLSGYKSDGGNTICSKVLAANSGYVSDYGVICSRSYSGYKSDVSGKSRSSVRSCFSRAKSCDLKNDIVYGAVRKVQRKKRSTLKHTKSLGNLNDQDILQLAGLSLGKSSEESSRESVCKPLLDSLKSKKYGEINRFVATGEYFRGSQFSSPLNVSSHRSFDNKVWINLHENLSKKLEKVPKNIHSRRSSVISQSSCYSNVSRCKKIRKRRSRLSKTGNTDSKINTEIEILIDSFSSSCRIHCTNNNKEKHKKVDERDKTFSQKCQYKRNIKKRKLSEATEITNKRRHKKSVSSSPDEHKLPLKKRHYLLAGREKQDVNILPKISNINSSSKLSPKKRHLLQTINTSTDEKSGYVNIDVPIIYNDKSLEKSDPKDDSCYNSLKGTKGDNLELGTSKIQTINNASTKNFVNNDKFPSSYPVPGIFEPSVIDLELQIPVSKLMSSSIITKSEIDSPIVFNKSFDDTKVDHIVEKLLNKKGKNILIKRKRKRINRTGFPTAKKKKKRYIFDNNNEQPIKKTIKKKLAYTTQLLCDRVPQIGEASDNYIKRNSELDKLSLANIKRFKPQQSKQDELQQLETNNNKIFKVTSKNSNSDMEFKLNNELSVKLGSSSKIIKKKNEEKINNNKKLTRKKTVEISNITAAVNIRKNQQILKSKKAEKIKLPEDKKVENNKIISLDENLEFPEHDPLPIKKTITESHSDINSTQMEVCVAKNGKSIYKKNNLVAGLLSNFYKFSKIKKQKSNIRSEELVSSSLGESLLPPPLYCESYYRRTVQDFCLPYDIWWEYKNLKLLKRFNVPSWNYKKIRTNVYGDVRPNPSSDHQPCNCVVDSACGDDCLNRMVYTECFPSNCPCKEKCKNQKIQRHDIATGIEKFMTESKGYGVRAIAPIKKGTYIFEYVGEVVTEKEFKTRMGTIYVNDTHHYCLHLDGGLVIDGHRMGSDGRFVNHSCSPNCEMQKWSVNGLPRMALFASRQIEPGEELTYDYNFSLFNPSEGQPCRCETPHCRGVIGGKYQRLKPIEQKVNENSIPNKNVRQRKRRAIKNTGKRFSKDIVVPTLQQLSDKELKLVKLKHVFLLRNLAKIKRNKKKDDKIEVTHRPLTPSQIVAQISALRAPRNIKTRGLTQAAHDPEIEKMAKVAIILKEICESIENVKGTDGKSISSKLLTNCKRKRISQYKKILDFPAIQSNVEKGLYKDPNMFDKDVKIMFENVFDYYASNSETEKLLTDLLKKYTEKKNEVYCKLTELVTDKKLNNFRPQQNFVNSDNLTNTEDIIRCICGLYRDEGLMIQCSKCLVWQHAECTQADVKIEHYLCEHCEPRTPNLEIPLAEFTEEGYRYYLSLLRGDLQVRQGDTVYVLRDIPITDDPENPIPNKKHTYETIGDNIDYFECDIFRVERLWKDNDGKRFIFGHHYLRPHETFHEPSRKFYHNEVVRVPLYEVVPIELVMNRCWVLEKNIFCKGRPVDFTSEEHVYICELRVDKSARFFSKAKQNYSTCTKSYAFKLFEEKLKVSRNYAPHILSPPLSKQRKRKPETSQSANTKKNALPFIHVRSTSSKTLQQKRFHLEEVLKNLKLKFIKYGESGLDISYLLSGRGARQRRGVTM